MCICVGAWLEAQDKMIVQAFFLNTNNCPHGLVKCACMRWKLHPSSPRLKKSKRGLIYTCTYIYICVGAWLEANFKGAWLGPKFPKCAWLEAQRV